MEKDEADALRPARRAADIAPSQGPDVRSVGAFSFASRSRNGTDRVKGSVASELSFIMPRVVNLLPSSPSEAGRSRQGAPRP